MTSDLTTRPVDQMLLLLSEAPDVEIDTAIAERIKALIGLSPDAIAARMKVILDECAHAFLASDFAMIAMDHVRRYAQSEGLLSINI